MEVEDEGFAAPGLLGHRNIQLQGMAVVPIPSLCRDSASHPSKMRRPPPLPPNSMQSLPTCSRTLWAWLGDLLDSALWQGRG